MPQRKPQYQPPFDPTVAGMSDALQAYKLGLITSHELYHAFQTYYPQNEIDFGIECLEVYANQET